MQLQNLKSNSKEDIEMEMDKRMHLLEIKSSTTRR